MPPKKIDFRVVNVSGEDEKYPSSELNSDKHGPLVQGWTSQRFCLYPIDLIIQFSKKVTVKKVQLLSHQSLIASKIEFYIGDCTDAESVDFQQAKYTRLGYVELSSNERTDYKARELKSVHLDAEGTFIKFVLHKNFVNRLNVYNQVGLVAINVIGIDPDDEVRRRLFLKSHILLIYNRYTYCFSFDF
jgi:centrosomal protein CEP104